MTLAGARPKTSRYQGGSCFSRRWPGPQSGKAPRPCCMIKRQHTGVSSMHKALLSLAALASATQPGVPPLLPLILPAAFAARPLVMAEFFEPLPEPTKHEDWLRYTLSQ